MIKMFMVLAIIFNVSFAFAQSASPEKVDALRLWQKRDEQQSLEQALQKFEKIHEQKPNDLETLTYLTRGYFLLADLHHTNKDQKMKNFEKAKNYGEKGLSLNSEYKKLAEDDVEKAINKVFPYEVPILYWTAAALGKWAKLNGVMSSLKYKDQILASIRKVEELKPDFFHAAVPRYWGGFYAVAPSLAGGDMDKSKKNFMKAIEMAPEYLGNKRLYAELYLVEKDNEKDFKKVLQEVINAPLGPEDITPENKLEKKEAERLLGKTKELF